MDQQIQFLIYQSAEQDIAVNAVVRDETIWLSQKGMAELFGVDVPAISKHLSNIYDEGELEAEATLSKKEIVQQEGTRQVKRVQAFYNLDAIISVSELLFSPIDFGGVCFYVISLFCTSSL